MVAAGQPIEAIETPGTIAVPDELVRRENSYVLRVRGDSMIDDGILDGDFIVVEEREAPDNGDTVVALVNGEATVKRFFREKNGKIRLEPANERLTPFVVKEKEFMSRGRVDVPPTTSDADAEAMEAAWAGLQAELAGLSTDSRHIVASGSGHYVQLERPDLVIGAVREMLERL